MAAAPPGGRGRSTPAKAIVRPTRDRGAGDLDPLPDGASAAHLEQAFLAEQSQRS